MAIISITFYLFANISWLISMKNGVGLSRGASIFAISSVLLGVAIGTLIYQEKLSWLQWSGVFVGIIALILILQE